jgi:hypothetical protein
LYAFKGPGTAHINGLIFDSIVHTGNPTLAPLGEHYGDRECVMIRIDNTSKKPVAIWLLQRSAGTLFEGDDLDHFERSGTQFVVYSSCNGHAHYAHQSSNHSEHHEIPSSGFPAGVEFFLRNDTKDGGQN